MRPILFAIAVLAVGVTSMGVFLGARAVETPRPKVHAASGVQAKKQANGETLRVARMQSQSSTLREPEMRGTRVAHAQGQLLLGAATGVEELADVIDDLVLCARKGSDCYDVAIDGQGAFEAHLPPGYYVFVARGERWFGQAEPVELTLESERRIQIVLEKAAKVSGILVDELRSQDFGELTVSDESNETQQVSLGEDGRSFEATGLIPGAEYRVSLPGYKIEEPEDGWVRAPARDVRLHLRPGPVLRGAMGLRRAVSCPLGIGRVYEKDETDEPTVEFDFDSKCGFEVRGIQAGTHGRLVVSGGGWHFEVPFVIPPTGDPDTICLDPPC